jgi:uncharacterized membrane protein YoaK (UPF0700 family)
MSTLTATTPRNTSAATPTWRTGARAGVLAGIATMVVAGGASQLGVSLETEPGQAIPVLGFGQLTVFFTAIGVVIARVLARRARRPRTTFVKTTVVLTALSLVPDIALHTDSATKLTLIATHLVAAAIVIPALSACLDDRTAS